MLDQYGLEATEEEIAEILAKVKKESYVTKSGVSDDMFLKFVNDVKNSKSEEYICPQNIVFL